MTAWDAYSVVALCAASLPSAYFAARTWAHNPAFARLSGLLAAALLVHAAYHFLVVLGASTTTILAVESASALLIFGFAAGYWRQRGASA